MFWAGDQHEPKWLTNMSGQQLLQEMHSHVNYQDGQFYLDPVFVLLPSVVMVVPNKNRT
jgi:hypothetical protein